MENLTMCVRAEARHSPTRTRSPRNRKTVEKKKHGPEMIKVLSDGVFA